jgi:hypothetical protein
MNAKLQTFFISMIGAMVGMYLYQQVVVKKVPTDKVDFSGKILVVGGLEVNKSESPNETKRISIGSDKDDFGIKITQASNGVMKYESFMDESIIKTKSESGLGAKYAARMSSYGFSQTSELEPERKKYGEVKSEISLMNILGTPALSIREFKEKGDTTRASQIDLNKISVYHFTDSKNKLGDYRKVEAELSVFSEVDTPTAYLSLRSPNNNYWLFHIDDSSISLDGNIENQGERFKLSSHKDGYSTLSFGGDEKLELTSDQKDGLYLSLIDKDKTLMTLGRSSLIGRSTGQETKTGLGSITFFDKKGGVVKSLP